MRLVGVESVAQDAVLGRNVYGEKGLLLLRQGTSLKTEYLKKMKQLGYYGAFVKDAVSDDIDIPDVIDEELRRDSVDTMRTLFAQTSAHASNIYMQSAKVAKMVNEILDQVLRMRGSVLNLRDLKTLSEYLYQHSVNVAVLSIYLGKEMGLNVDNLRALGLAAMLHDMGMTAVDRRILMKTDKLTHEEHIEVQKHAAGGYEILKNQMRTDATVYVAVLQHHERFDGAGYPNKKKGADISKFARIIAVADAYDALTSVRSYREPFLPSDAYEYVLGSSGQHLDPEVVSVFAKKVAPFPAGSTVKLSDGRTALIVENNSSFILRPLIRIVEDKTDNFTMIDLSRDPSARSLTIVDMV